MTTPRLIRKTSSRSVSYRYEPKKHLLRRTLLATLIGLGFSSFITGCATNPSSSATEAAKTSANGSSPENAPAPKAEATITPSPQAPAAPVSFEDIATIDSNDPYRPLELLDRAETQHWMKAQHDTSRHYLAELIQSNNKKKKPDADAISAPNETTLPQDSNLENMQRVGSQLFYFRANEHHPKVLYVRSTIESKEERELIDVSHLDKISSHSIIEDFRVSPDGRWVALIIANNEHKGQSISRQLIVADTKNGKVMLRPIANIESTPFLSWRPDSQAVFFLQRNDSGAVQVIMRLLAGSQAGKTLPVFGPQLGLDHPLEADEHMGIIASPASPYTLAIVQSPKGLRIFSALAPQLSGNSISPVQGANGTTQPEMRITWYPLIGLQDQVTSFDFRGDWFYAITHRQKPTGELVRLRLSEPRWEEADLLIPSDEKQSLSQLRVAQDALYVEKREGGYSHLIKLPYNARYQNTGELQSLPDRSSSVPNAPANAASPSVQPASSAMLPTPSDMAKTTPVQPGQSTAPFNLAPPATTASKETGTLTAVAASTDKTTAASSSQSNAPAPVHKALKRHGRRHRLARREALPLPKVASTVATTAENSATTDAASNAPVKQGKKTRKQRREERRKAQAQKNQVAKASSKNSSRHAKAPQASTQQQPEPTAQSKKKTRGKPTVATSKKDAAGRTKHASKKQASTTKVSVAPKVRSRRRERLHARRQRHFQNEVHNEVTEQRRARVRSRVIRLALPSTTPNTQDIKLPVDGIIQQLVTDPLQPGVLARMNNWTRPLEVVHIDPQQKPYLIEKTPSAHLDKEETSKSADNSQTPTQTSRLLVPSDDSPNAIMLPLTLISPEGIEPANSKKPLLLILDKPGQGFAASTYRADILTWLKKGGIVALADLFPKGIKENEWLDKAQYVADAQYTGRLENIVDYLYSEKIAMPDRFVVTGDGVNASLLANLLVTHPNRFTGAVLQGGVYDSLHWEFAPPLKGATLTSQQQDHFKRLWNVSSYHHIKDRTQYPGVLVLGNTDRKLVIQAAKLAARLQNAESSNHAYFYSAARPLSDETRLLFLWNQIISESSAL